MNLNVSTRIFGGFLLVLGLSALIFLTAIFGIQNINDSIEDVTGNSMPMQQSAAKLEASLLESDIELLKLFTESRSDKIAESETAYNKQKSSNLKEQSNSQKLTANHPDLQSYLTKVAKSSNQFFTASDGAIELRKSAIQLEQKVSELGTEFSDMADEMLSFTYDLEGISDSADTESIVNELSVDIENAVSAANSSISTAIKFEVLGNRSVIQGMVEGIESKLNQLNSDAALSGGEELVAMQDAFARFKNSLLGSNNVQDVKLKTLEALDKAKQNLQAAQDLASSAQKDLAEFNAAVSTYTESIKSDASSIVSNAQAVIVVLAVIVTTISLAVSFWVTKSIRTPLDNAVKNIKKVSKGDLTVDFGQPANDELGVLTSNMQNLVNNLRTILHDIADSSNMLATTAEQTTSISNQSYDSVMKEKEQSHLVMSSIKEMADSVASVSESINQTLDAVEIAHDEVSEGDTLLKENIERIGNLATAIESAASVISKLNEETGNIEAVLEVIRGVAEQTNLLALNAAIEAARAGEQGRGFAVVADEVRTLASRTHDSTEEIQELIQRLLNGSKEAVRTMGNSQEETQQCVSGINDVGTMLTTISSRIDKIKDMSQAISGAAEEQSKGAVEQINNVQVIVDLSEITASSAEENREASQSLASMAEKQRSLVSRFTV